MSTEYEVECIDKNAIKSNRQAFYLPENENEYSNQAIMVTIITPNLVFLILRFIVVRFGGTPTLAYLLATIACGDNGLKWNKNIGNIFLPYDFNGHSVQIVGFIGIMLYLFLIGVKTDLSIIGSTSRKAWIMGITSFITPLILTVPLAIIQSKSFSKNEVTDDENSESDRLIGPLLPIIALLSSTTSFPAISCFLADIKILNTELGRLAISVSTISGTCSLLTTMTIFLIKQQYFTIRELLPYTISLVAMILTIFLSRKLVFWMVKQTPKGKTIKETALFSIFFMIFGIGYIGECLGLNSWLGPFLFGLAISDGGSIGSAMTDKLESIVFGILMPPYIVNFSHIPTSLLLDGVPTFPYRILSIITLGLIGKLSGTIIPCLFFQMHFKDAFILGVILTTLGIFDLILHFEAYNSEYIDETIFFWIFLYTVTMAAVTPLLVRFLYKPSRKYIVTHNRAIQYAKQCAEFRILACIYNEANVPPIVNLLNASNPTRKSPISIYLLHIIELQGRSTSVLISHQPQSMQLDKSTPSDHIINCFRIYEKQNRGNVTVHPFTTITPFESAHNDICTIAVDNITSLIIIPFHKQWNINGITESSKQRTANREVIDKAPCSVGILIDRGRLNNAKPVGSCWSTYIIGLIFLGGCDDREALYYGMRMAEHPTIHITVHRLIPIDNTFTVDNINDKILDDNLINQFRLDNIVNENNMYREEVVKDGFEVVRVIRALENSYDLLIVGRYQDNYLSFLSELTKWNEYPELGFFGDMCASSDFKGKLPILVVQQHSLISKYTVG